MRHLLLLLWLGVTDFADSLVAHPKLPLLPEQLPRHVKRDSNGACGPVYDGLEARSVRRETLILIQRNASALEKRMELPDLKGRRPMPDFFHKEMPKWKPFVNLESAATATDLSASIIQDLTKLGNLQGTKDPATQFSTGTAELKGCTTLYIISRNGVFAAHYWESISFDPDDDWLPKGQDKWTPELKDAIFQSTVLDPLKFGSRYHPKVNAKLLDDDSIKAYLIVPNKTWKEGEGDTGYQEQWTKIEARVGEIIPTLLDKKKWGRIPYIPAKKELLKSRYYAVGKNIFKYDQKHPTSTGETQHKAALWVEDSTTPWHDDTW